MKPPSRGEVCLVDLGLAAKVRPALVVSIPAEDADRALVTLVPHTTATRGSRFEVQLRVTFLRPGAFDVQGIVTVPHAKLVRALGAIPSPQMSEIEVRLLLWRGISKSA